MYLKVVYTCGKCGGRGCEKVKVQRLGVGIVGALEIQGAFLSAATQNDLGRAFVGASHHIARQGARLMPGAWRPTRAIQPAPSNPPFSDR